MRLVVDYWAVKNHTLSPGWMILYFQLYFQDQFCICCRLLYIEPDRPFPVGSLV